METYLFSFRFPLCTLPFVPRHTDSAEAAFGQICCFLRLSMSQATIHAHRQGTGHSLSSLQSPAGSGPPGSPLSPEAEAWHLYRTWPSLMLGPSFTVSQPLSRIPSLPARDPTGRAFRVRLCVLAPVLELAQRELLALQSGVVPGAARWPTEEELALTILLTAYILLESYLSEGVEASLQPFRPLVEGCASAFSSSGGGQGSAAHVRSNLTQALQGLLNDVTTLASRSASEILELQEAHDFSLRRPAAQGTAISRSASPTLQPDEALLLLDLASERALSLSESRKLSDALKHLSYNGLKEQLGPDKFAAIAVHTPRIAVELIEAMASPNGQSGSSANSSWKPELYFQAAGSRLPVNESKSFDFMLKLLGLNVGAGEAVPFLVYRHLLPTYLSRCFSAISQTEEARRNESQDDVAVQQEDGGDLQEEEVHYRRSSLSESTTRDLDSLLGFLHRTSLLDLFPLLESGGATQQQTTGDGPSAPVHLRRIAEALHRRALNGAPSLTLEQCQGLYDTLEAVAVEMKAFALEMVRYRSGGELLRRLM